MTRILLIIAFLPYIALNAQDKMPGGVYGAEVWEITKIIKPGQSGWEPNLKSTLDSGLAIRGKLRTINYNPALLFSDGSDTRNSTLHLGTMPAFSLFTVCQDLDTLAERIVLSLENDSAAELALTNRRMAALDMYKYRNYTPEMPLYPKIYSYTQNKTSGAGITSRKLHLGHPPQLRLPATVYSGLMPEVILFNRAISPGERQQVESYLALKYGISLDQEFPASYLNSKGEIIWDAWENLNFNRNIAGIGRDDLSNLNQTFSGSTQTPGLMKIGLPEGELKNNSFLIWGDDGGALRISTKPGIRRLLRNWRISSFNFKDPVEIEIDELSLNEIKPLKDNEIYWLMVDRSGTGKYPLGQTGYWQASSLSDKLIKFRGITMDADSTGSDVFTLLAAPSFFSRSIIQSPSCLAEGSGIISTEIAGGTPPFRLLLKSISGRGSPVSGLETGRVHVFEGISQGGYLLTVRDAGNNSFSEELWVSNAHLWETSIKQDYSLIDGESLTLNASEGMPAVSYRYMWSTPDGSMVNGEKIIIDQQGKYLLSVTDENNCNSTVDVNVRYTGKSNIRNLELYPNPSGGLFELRVSLVRIMDVSITLTDNNGKVLKTMLLKNDNYYQVNDIIRQPGIYFITIRSAIEKETLKLIIQ